MLSYCELQTLKKEIARLKERGELLDPTNCFERRELQAIIRQLRALSCCVGDKKKVHLRIVKDDQ